MRSKCSLAPTNSSGMPEQDEREEHEEQVQFAAFKQFCDDPTVERTCASGTWLQNTARAQSCTAAQRFGCRGFRAVQFVKREA